MSVDVSLDGRSDDVKFQCDSCKRKPTHISVDQANLASAVFFFLCYAASVIILVKKENRVQSWLCTTGVRHVIRLDNKVLIQKDGFLCSPVWN